jgi:hypothetical protein
MSGGEIKSVLSLDVTKFASSLDRATSDLDSFDKKLKSASKVAVTFEADVKSLAGGMETASGKFNMLDQVLESFAARLNKTASGLESVDSHSTGATKGIDALSAALKNTNSINADQWIEKYASQLGMLAPEIKKTVSSILELDRANIVSGEIAEKSAGVTVAAKLRALEAEKAGNNKIIADRERMVAELNLLQTRMQSRSDSASIIARRYFGKNQNSEAGAGYHASVAEFQASAAAAAQEAVAISAVVKEYQYKNNEVIKSIALIREEEVAERVKSEASKASAVAAKEAAIAQREAAQAQKAADAASVAASKLAAQERMRNAREVAEYERAQANQIAQMWKSMGQLWAASKIEHGLVASVNQASEMERAKVAVKSLNYSSKENQQIYDDSARIGADLKFVSAVDSLKLYLAGIGALGANKPDELNATLPTVIKAANNLQQMGFASGEMRDTVKNIYGLSEMRGHTADAAAMNNDANLVQKIVTGSQGKVTPVDIDVLTRKIGSAANQMSDMGIVYASALANAQKAAGGEGGGAGGSGVASTGTFIKMILAYAEGKTLSNKAVSEFSGAGILATGGLDLRKDKSGILSDAKHAGFKDADKWMQNPVQMMQTTFPMIVAYTKQHEKEFYQGRDSSNPDNELNAVTKFLQKLGIQQTGVTAWMQAGSPKNAARLNDEANTTVNSKNTDQVNEDLEKTYLRHKQNFTVAVADMEKVIGGHLIPVLNGLLDALTYTLNGMKKFAEENPIATQLSILAVVVGGVALAVKGAMGLFGGLASLSSVLKGLAGATGEVTAANMAAGPGMFAFGERMTMLGATVTKAASLIARGFMRLIPVVGMLLLAWDFASIISNLEVGGAKIKDWAIYLFDWLITKFQNGWERIKDFTSLGMFHAENEANIASNNADLLGRAKANGIGLEDAPIKPAAHTPGSFSGSISAPFIPKPFVPAGKDGKSTEIDTTGKSPRTFEDLFNKAYQDVLAKEKVLDLRISSIGGESSYANQAKESVLGKLAGGQFDLGKEQKNRGEFLRSDVRYSPSDEKYYTGKGAKRKEVTGNDVFDLNKKGKAGITPNELIEHTQKVLENEAAFKRLTFAKERSVSITEEANALSKRYSAGLNAETAAMSALNREFAREGARNPDGSLKLSALEQGMTPAQRGRYNQSQARLGQSEIDSLSLSDSEKGKTEGLNSNFITDAKGRAIESADRIREQHDKTISDANDVYQAHAVSLAKSTADEKIAANGVETEGYLSALRIQKGAADNHAAYIIALEKQKAEALLTPVQKLALEWQKSYSALDQMNAKWADGFMTNLQKVLTGGKVHWRDFLNSMISDLGKLAMNKALGGMVENMFSNIGKGLKWGLDKVNLGSGAGAGSGTGSSSAANTADEGLTKLATSSKDLVTAKGRETQSVFASIVAWGKNTWASLFGTSVDTKKTAGKIVEASAEETATTRTVLALGGLSFAAGQAAAALASVAVTSAIPVKALGGAYSLGGSEISMFADGGTFTNGLVDSPTLFKFANGSGFGTGVMGEAGPEAIMPLSKDSNGRLGVSLHNGSKEGGSDGSVVNISIVVNKDGGESSAGSGDAGGTWKKVADRVKAVVLQEIGVQKRPGGLLYN